VLAASTLGSLAGTFGTTFLFVPRAGLTATYLGAGLALAVCGLLFLVRRRPVVGGLAGLLALCALAFARHDPAVLPHDVRLIEARETTYQSARVVEVGDGAERMRRLEVNESFGSFQSVWQPQTGLLPPGYYYNAFALPVWWTTKPTLVRALVLGLGAGTTWRVLEGALPPDSELEATGVEIDPGVVELGRNWMDLPPDGRSDRIVVAGMDARVALRCLPRRFDLIVLDAYQNQMEIPPQLASVEFFAEARESLATGGYLAVNVGGFGLDDPVLVALASTVATAFASRVLAVRIPFSRNVALYARADALPPDPNGDWFVPSTGPLVPLASAMSVQGTSRWFEPLPTAPLTDDRNPMLLLQRASVERAARSGP
jgi:spermidine synthase